LQAASIASLSSKASLVFSKDVFMKRKTFSTEGVSSSITDIVAASTALGIPRQPSINEEIKATRNRVLLLASTESVQHLDKDGILVLQSLLQHGSKYGYWLTPQKWAPSGDSQATLNVDLRKRIVHFLSKPHQRLVHEADVVKENIHKASETGVVLSLPTAATWVHHLLEGAVLTITRYLVILRMGPVGIGDKRRNTSLDPSNVKDIGYSYLPQLLALGVSKWLRKDISGAVLDDITPIALPINVGFLSRIQAADLDSMSESSRKLVNREIQRMRILEERELWSDVPVISDTTTKPTDVAGPERPRQPQQKPEDPHLPLPDDYVSEMGRRSLWLIQDLAPNLLTIAQEIQSIWHRTDDLTLKPTSVRYQREMQLEEYLRSYVWRDSQGSIISVPPFFIRLAQSGKKRKKQSGKNSIVCITATEDLAETEEDSLDKDEIVMLDSSENFAWPPKSFAQIMGLLNNVQLAHLFVVALSTGGRKSETLNLERCCVQYARNGMPYANGRTFKLVKQHDGQMRDWVLPDLAVQAIEQQVRLVSLAEAIGPLIPKRLPDGTSPPPEKLGSHLWGRISGLGNSGRTNPLLGINGALIAYAEALGMDTTPGGQNLRSHRFRKTVARLVALALTQAPKVLMDVFGHDCIESTLYYILNDKDLRGEIEEVSRELRVMRAKEVIETIVANEDKPEQPLPLGGYGGPASLMVGKAIEVQKERLHQHGQEWGADTTYELAEILTLQGKAWQLVREGVICTKFPGTESGPCNKSKGHPEPARCQTDCKHRLEEAFLREDVDGAIQSSVNAYKKAGANGEDLVQALWAGQIRAHLGRFEDLREKWMKDSTVQQVASVVAEEKVPA
jgi:integrase